MRKRIAQLSWWLLPLLLWIGSEVYYAARIRPKGVRTLADHYRRFGEPRRITSFQRGGTNFYELSGHISRARAGGIPLLVFPSSPPAYVYDQTGALVDWCSDPGDQPSYRARWPQTGTQPVEPATFRAQYGL